MSKRTILANPGAVLSVALRLANRGYDHGQIVRELLRDAAVNRLFLSAGEAPARRFAQRTADRALERVATHPAARDRGAFLLEIAEIRRAADEAAWPGRTGPTDRRVLEGALVMAERARSTSLGLSARSWGLLVVLPWRTVMNSRDRLVEIGALSVVAPARREARKAIRYRIINLRVGTGPGSALPGGAICARTAPGHLNHDAFRPAGLGCAGWFLISRLDPTDALPVGSFLELGLTRARAYRVLGELQAAEIAVRVPDGWIRVPDEQLGMRLDAVAFAAGTWGALSRQADEHLLDRIKDDARPRKRKPPSICASSDTRAPERSPRRRDDCTLEPLPPGGAGVTDEAQVLEGQARSLLDRAVERFAIEATHLNFADAERCARVAFAAELLQEDALGAS